jgi:predicted amino acid dehydrogenase
MEELGVTEPQAGEFPRSFEWFNCPVRGPNGAEIKLSFRLLPILADRFLALMQSDKVNKTKLAAEWVEAEFVASVEAAIAGGYDLTFGAGALTKDPIKHGQGLIDKYPDLAARVAITDGNAGTATLIQEQVLRAGFQPGDTVAVFGPTGGLGCGVAQLLLDLQPESLLLLFYHKKKFLASRSLHRAG